MGVVSMGLFDKLFGRGNGISEEDAIIEFSNNKQMTDSLKEILAEYIKNNKLETLQERTAI